MKGRVQALALCACLTVVFGAAWSSARTGHDPAAQSVALTQSSWQYVSGPYHLDRLFSSMAGPGETKDGIALSGSDNELLWLTGYQVTDLEGSKEEAAGQEFLCHNNLYLEGSVSQYRHLLGTRTYGSPRIFTLAQGSSRITFPKGFAIPLPSRQKLGMRTQVLNLLPEHVGRTVSHQVRSYFLHDSELEHKPIPLFLVEAAGKVLLKDPASKTPSQQKAAAATFSTDRRGRVSTGHWLVPPGEHTNVTRVTKAMALPFDTTAHYIISHLHPYARWQELRDVTTGQVVHRAEVRSSADGRTIAEVTTYSSPVGLPLFVNHQYELVTNYNNTSKAPVTAMSMLFVYCRDKEFTHYDPDQAGPVGDPSMPRGDTEEFCDQPHPAP